MQRIYWYKIRRNSILEAGSIQGWQTNYDETHVVDQLKKTYGDRLAYVYYEKENGEQVPLYSNL